MEDIDKKCKDCKHFYTTLWLKDKGFCEKEFMKDVNFDDSCEEWEF